MNYQNERNKMLSHKNRKKVGNYVEVKDFKYSSTSRLDGNDLGITNYDCIFENLFSKNINENDFEGLNMNSNVKTIMNQTAVNMNMKHQPTKMNYDVTKNFPNKVSRSITEDNDKVDNIHLNKNNKRGSFVPWKRAEIDPDIVKKGTEIHLNPIPHNINHEDLYKLFKHYGDIIHIRIIPRKEKGNSFAFIRFLEKHSAEKALNDRIININANSVRITKSKEESTIFIGNIRKYWTESHVSKIIIERVSYFDRMRFFQDPSNPGRNRGYCFIEYDNPMMAREAYDKLNRNIVLDNTSLTIDWADEFDSNQDINKFQIHLSGLNDNVNTEDLYTVFGQYGNIINIKLARDMERVGRKDYGFVTYSNEEESARALKEFNWKEYFDSPINLQYARKISAIIKHKQKTKGDMLEKKRRRDNLIQNTKDDDASESEDHQVKNFKKQEQILDEFNNLLTAINNNHESNLSGVMNQMISFISNNINNNSNNITRQTPPSITNSDNISNNLKNSTNPSFEDKMDNISRINQ